MLSGVWNRNYQSNESFYIKRDTAILCIFLPDCITLPKPCFIRAWTSTSRHEFLWWI